VLDVPLLPDPEWSANVLRHGKEHAHHYDADEMQNAGEGEEMMLWLVSRYLFIRSCYAMTTTAEAVYAIGAGIVLGLACITSDLENGIATKGKR